MSPHIEDFTNIVDVTYAQDRSSVNTNELGMREMQARVFEQRASHEGTPSIRKVPRPDVHSTG